MSMLIPPERTLVQERRPYDPRYDVRTDAVAVYGVDATLPERIADWRARGYHVHLMTGLAWGEYQEYLLGRWDGHQHWDEAQHRADGTPKQHGQDTPYMVPTERYAAYLEQQMRKAIDAGVEAIFLEEPEFWSYTGYGPAFQRAWQTQYGEPWRDPTTDPLAWTMAARLKQQLYQDLIVRLCRTAKAYSASRGDSVRCYVATHSPLNYTAWAIVSPELRLRDIPELDGFIVQTWSFTARSQTTYEGRSRERLFAVAFLEYGSGIELARCSERHLWFLADPVEDRPNQGWDYYRIGYHATIAAALCWPEVHSYEVMPWPWRVFTRRYPHRSDGTGGEPIPQAYASEILAIANALRAMPGTQVEWNVGTPGLGVLFSDTMMFRRGGPQHDDPNLSTFYALALPLLLAGMPVRPVGMELVAEGTLSQREQTATQSNVTEAQAPDVRVLLLSYDGMTPPSAAAHQALAEWVRDGGVLLCFGSGDGPYETLPGWWNEEEHQHDPWLSRLRRPAAAQPPSGPWPDLFQRLGLQTAPTAGIHPIGRGVVLIEPRGPITLASSADGAATVRARVREALAALGPGAPVYREQGYLSVCRGPYVIAAVCAEEAHTAPLQLTGRYIDLFDGGLPARQDVVLRPGDCAFLLDLDRLRQGPFQQGDPTQDGNQPTRACVAAASTRIDDERSSEGLLRFRATGPSGTMAVIRLRLPAPPRHVVADGTTITWHWDAPSGTALIRHANVVDGMTVEVQW